MIEHARTHDRSALWLLWFLWFLEFVCSLRLITLPFASFVRAHHWGLGLRIPEVSCRLVGQEKIHGESLALVVPCAEIAFTTPRALLCFHAAFSFFTFAHKSLLLENLREHQKSHLSTQIHAFLGCFLALWDRVVEDLWVSVPRNAQQTPPPSESNSGDHRTTHTYAQIHPDTRHQTPDTVLCSLLRSLFALLWISDGEFQKFLADCDRPISSQSLVQAQVLGESVEERFDRFTRQRPILLSISLLCLLLIWFLCFPSLS
jgi:hypothetical protein